ncbi:uncharacterized protein LOC117752193, partial [Hippoglossus hippoglossus]|uniref:uncharacterized protein LOC117752193 n=1 Tax=Hippoglossus hippoglossus TaxID=8267 RepID=UPI00148B7C26
PVLSVGFIFVFECSVSNRSFVVLQHNWTQIFSGETISVRCEIQGGGDTQWEYEWRTTSSHQPVTGPNTAPTHSEYRLGTASVFHSGEYWCKARADLYSSTEWSDAFQLRVTPNKPRPRLTADNTTITGKGSAALICSVDNAAEWRYDWFRRTSASAAAQILRYNETDDEISISEEGIYNCRGRRGDTTVFTEDSNLVTIENRVSHKASVALQPDWSLIFSGEMITVRCEVPADGLTEWEYEWTKPNSTTVPTHNEHRIVNASSSDSGSYRCLAKDKKNLNSTTEWSDDVTLTVSERPAANLRADHRAFPVGGSVLLTCSVGPSSPGWNYYWYRGEKTSEPLTDEDFKSDGQSASASREGQYWCRGGRGDPVYYTEYSHSVRIHEIVHNRAAVTLQPNWPNRYRGETVTLGCEIQGGDSEWEYEWTATSSHAPPNTKEFRISVGSHVSGSYWCQGRLKGARQNSTGWSVPLTLSNATAPRPVVTVSPSWLTPGASVTLTCGVPHPAAGWRFSWYRLDLSSLNQLPSCPQSFLDRMGPMDISDQYRYELLPGSNGGTEQNSSVIRGQTESAGYACRAGRGDPVFYTEYSDPKWVWSGDSYSSVSLTVSPDSVQHNFGDRILLTCEGNSDELRLWRFTGDQVLLLECSSHKTRFTWPMERHYFRSAVYCCGSGSELSNAVNISSVPGGVILESPVHPVTEGQSVTLRCSSFRTNLYSNFSFYKNGELLRRDVRGKLEISAVSKSDEGFYKCEHSGVFSRKSWMSVKSTAPRPVVTVSPSWLTPGASVTLTCGVPHPAAGWRFSWYRVYLSSLNQVPRCPPSFLDWIGPMDIPEFSYELLPGSNGGTEQNSSVIRGQTESAGYACRAGRGDPVFYTEYSKIKWVWSGDSYSSVSLTVSPDSVQHDFGDRIRLTCEGNSDELRLWRFTGDQVLLFECRSHKTKFTWSMDNLRSAVYCCGSGSEISNALNITRDSGRVILESPAHPVTEGQSVTLRCSSFRTNLYSNFSFYKNGELLRRDVRGKLEISAVSKSDEGLYKCEHSGVFSPESWMSVKYSDRVILDSPVRPVTEGQSVTLRCSSFRTNLYSNFSFYKNGELLRRDVRGELEISAVSKSDEGLYKCEHSGFFSPESWMSVKSPPSASPVALVVGLVGGITLILLLSLLLLCWYRNSKNLCCDRLSQSLRTNQSSDPPVHPDENQLQVYSSLLHGDNCIYESIRGDTEEGTRGDPEERSDYVNENPHSASGAL